MYLPKMYLKTVPFGIYNSIFPECSINIYVPYEVGVVKQIMRQHV